MIVVVLLVVTALLWGTTPVMEKFGLRLVDPFTGLVIRNLAVALILLLVVLVTGKVETILKTDSRALIIFAVSGLMAGLLGMWTYFLVLKMEPASKIVPLAATYPLVTAILSVFLLGEKFSPVRLIGTILIIAGIWLVK